MTKLTTDVAIVGAGTAGLYALREVRRAGGSFVLIDQGPLGTTCARVGCMPSKVALHAGAMWAARGHAAAMGVEGAEHLRIDLARTWAHVRQWRDEFAGGAANKTRHTAGEQLLMGTACLETPQVLSVQTPEGAVRVEAQAIVLATGSRPVMPAWLAALGDRVVTTDGFFELPALPERMGVLGLGAIGLEMGLALSRLGVHVIGADMAPVVAGISDPLVAALARDRFGREMTLWLDQPTSVERSAGGVMMRSGDRHAEVDLVLAALGRRPNVDALGLAEVGVTMDARGTPIFNPQTMQVGDLPLFIAGDANADRPLMHEACDEGSIAGYNAAQWAAQGAAAQATAFQRKVSLGIAFTDPDVVSVGERFDRLTDGEVLVGTARGEGNGRTRILGGEQGLVRVYADRQTGRLRGAAMVAVRGEHLAHLLAWAIQRGETARAVLQLPFYHPVVEEMLQSALQDIVRQQGDHCPWPMGLQALSSQPGG